VIACYHLSPDGNGVEGVWWTSGRGELQNQYREEVSVPALMGAITMALKVPTVSWLDFWGQLSGRAPYVAWWEVVEVSECSEEALLDPSVIARARPISGSW